MTLPPLFLLDEFFGAICRDLGIYLVHVEWCGRNSGGICRRNRYLLNSR